MKGLQRSVGYFDGVCDGLDVLGLEVRGCPLGLEVRGCPLGLEVSGFSVGDGVG